MRMRTLFVIVVVTLIVAGAAFYFVKHREEGYSNQFSASLLFPGLKDKLNDIDSIEMMAPDITLKLLRKENQWVVPEKFDYAADFKNIKQNLTALAELIRVEPKTKRSEHFKELGVAPVEKDSKGFRFIAKAQGIPLVDVYLGNKAAGIQDGYFVRLEGDNQVWLARGNIKMSPDQKEWLKTDMFSVEKERIHEISFYPESGSDFTVWRESPQKTSFQMKPVPEGRKIKSPYTVDMVAKGISDLNFADVLPKERVDFSETPWAIFNTFDGMRVEVFIGKAQKRPGDEDLDSKSNREFLSKAPGGRAESNQWLWFRFSFDAETHKKYLEDSKDKKDDLASEVEKLNAKLSSWAYYIPSYKFEIIKRDLESMLEPLPPEENMNKKKK